jgi:hypothetical protein
MLHYLRRGDCLSHSGTLRHQNAPCRRSICAPLTVQSEALLLVCVLAKVDGALRLVDWAFLGCRAVSRTTDASMCIEATFAQRGSMYADWR